MGLLSSYPILESGQIAEDPPVIWARLDVGGARPLSVIAAHPLPGSMGSLGPLPLPFDYDVGGRDAQIRTIRSLTERLLALGDPLILAGDFNVTDREPAYADLASGLLDAHLEVGLGPGSTWRPDAIKWLPLGFLRIDMVLAGNAARPVSSGVDCTLRGSDHCVVEALIALP
jgi:endonuclease/exonuclease/phosphatase (EEP) superfamily protein YafD